MRETKYIQTFVLTCCSILKSLAKCCSVPKQQYFQVDPERPMRKINRERKECHAFGSQSHKISSQGWCCTCSACHQDFQTSNRICCDPVQGYRCIPHKRTRRYDRNTRIGYDRLCKRIWYSMIEIKFGELLAEDEDFSAFYLKLSLSMK